MQRLNPDDYNLILGCCENTNSHIILPSSSHLRGKYNPTTAASAEIQFFPMLEQYIFLLQHMTLRWFIPTVLYSKTQTYTTHTQVFQVISSSFVNKPSSELFLYQEPSGESLSLCKFLVKGLVRGWAVWGSNSSGRYFLHLSRPALEPNQPPIQWVPCLSQG
jgi:hypothetical protein